MRGFAAITAVEEKGAGAVWKKLDSLTKPRRSLGVLEECALRLCLIQQTDRPRTGKKVVFTLAADHGVAAAGVSRYPQEVTAQMVLNFLREGAAVNVLARHAGVRVVVVDMGVAADIPVKKGAPGFLEKKIDYGTRNFFREPAMTRQEAKKALAAGAAVFAREARRGIDIVGLGEMGIANTTAASAIVSRVTGRPVAAVTGRGTGITRRQWEAKVKGIEGALRRLRPDPRDPLALLSAVGGFEIAGLAGVILAAAQRRVPVVLDGFITSAAALIGALIEPRVKGYLFASHLSVERGHRAGLSWLGLQPLFDLRMRLGEGTGACLGIQLLEASAKILNEMATFEEAGVSPAKR